MEGILKNIRASLLSLLRLQHGGNIVWQTSEIIDATWATSAADYKSKAYLLTVIENIDDESLLTIVLPDGTERVVTGFTIKMRNLMVIGLLESGSDIELTKLELHG